VAWLKRKKKMNTEQKIRIPLNIFDDEGNMVDTTDCELTISQISDIIDHAAQLILLHRDEKPIGEVLSELDEALSVSDVLDYKETSKEEWPENYDKPDFLKPDVMAGYQKLKR